MTITPDRLNQLGLWVERRGSIPPDVRVALKDLVNEVRVQHLRAEVAACSLQSTLEDCARLRQRAEYAERELERLRGLALAAVGAR